MLTRMQETGLTKSQQNLQPDENFSDLNIIASIESMVRQIVFIKDIQPGRVRIVGDYTDEEFQPKSETLVDIDRIAYEVDDFLRLSRDFVEDEKVVKGLFVLKKAEALITFLKLIDPDNDYFEYLVVITNNIAFLLLKYPSY